jgi:hypothetical protein
MSSCFSHDDYQNLCKIHLLFIQALVIFISFSHYAYGAHPTWAPKVYTYVQLLCRFAPHIAQILAISPYDYLN